MKYQVLLPFAIIPVLLAVALVVGLPTQQATADTDSPIVDVAQPLQEEDGEAPQVVTVEVTVEVTREVTVVVTPTFTPLPPTSTPLPPELTVDDDAFIGAADAPVKVVEFSDYRCGFCGRFYATTLTPLTDHFGDMIQFVYRDYPIFGEESLAGAIGAECAGDQGEENFWLYHNLIFDNQLQQNPLPLSLDTLTAFAEELDLDLAEWNTCFNSDDTQNEVVLDALTGQEWGVTGTPTFFINGRRLVGAQPLETFISMINEELVALGFDPVPLEN